MLAGSPTDNRGGTFPGGEGRRGGESVLPTGCREKTSNAGKAGGGGMFGAEAGGSRGPSNREDSSNSESD